ncbi:MAG: DNA cytosine methyltransferase [Bryobacterales bacterium]|nr:DNA cytosine methyltransferase [Bryobacterales bacterium]
MSVYYNEIEPSAIAWLKELIKAGEIPDGHIDTRSIVDVRPEELSGFDQCHFFAGIAGWPLALRMAGYEHVKGLWTGSCPCQPFSAAGKRKGTSDARHLWPEMRRLVEQCRPAIVLGEQVASKDGRSWCAGVRADMEALGYAFGAADLCAAGIGAPHIRQRLYWGARMAEPERTSSEQGRATDKPAEGTGAGSAGTPDEPGRRGDIGGGPGDANHPRSQGHGNAGERTCELSPWSSSTLIHCADGKTRRICPEPGVFPLAHGVPGRVGLLRGYGNAIVPQLAAIFVESFIGAAVET